VTDWICVAKEGINRAHEFALRREDIALIARRTEESLSRATQT